jgi:hypothetical protein
LFFDVLIQFNSNEFIDPFWLLWPTESPKIIFTLHFYSIFFFLKFIFHGHFLLFSDLKWLRPVVQLDFTSSLKKKKKKKKNIFFFPRFHKLSWLVLFAYFFFVLRFLLLFLFSFCFVFLCSPIFFSKESISCR